MPRAATDYPAPTLRLVAPGDPAPEISPDLWAEVGRVAGRNGSADMAGVVLGRHGPRIGAPLADAMAERLAQRLRDRHGCVAADAATGLHLAAARIDDGPDGALLWIGRHRTSFARGDLTALRALATAGVTMLRALAHRIDESELLLREHRHRCANDLQMVGTLLSHRARHSGDARIGDALGSAATRVMALAHARQAPPADLSEGLRLCCEALRAQVDERGIVLHLAVEGRIPAIDERRTAVLLIAVNELVTNAIKHAFPAERWGLVKIALSSTAAGIRVTVDDDGAPMPGPEAGGGSGFDLVRRLVAGARGTIAFPDAGTKRFTIDMPLAMSADRRNP